MPYKDPAKQRAAQRRSYLRNRDRIAARAKASRDQRNIYVRDRRQRLKQFVIETKLGKLCADCGGGFPPFVLDYHHVSGEKVAGIRELIRDGYSEDVILAEIAKCILLCSNCHRIRHHSEVQPAAECESVGD